MKSPNIMISQDPNDYTTWCPICNKLANCGDIEQLEAEIITHDEVRHINIEDNPKDQELESYQYGSMKAPIVNGL